VSRGAHCHRAGATVSALALIDRARRAKARAEIAAVLARKAAAAVPAWPAVDPDLPGLSGDLPSPAPRPRAILPRRAGRSWLGGKRR
jgi:hypothetical protein